MPKNKIPGQQSGDDVAGYGPATEEGEPLDYSDIADVTVNTAKGIGRSMLKTLKGDSKGASDELDTTRKANREMSKRAAARKRGEK